MNIFMHNLLLRIFILALPILFSTAANAQNGFVGADSVVVQTNNCAAKVEVCFTDLPLNTAKKLEILVDGLLYPDTLTLKGCNIDTTRAYTYSTLFGQGSLGPYRLDSWQVNNTVFSGIFQNIPALVDSMNKWDPMGMWMLDATSQIISGGQSGTFYKQMDVTVLLINTPSFIGFNIGTNSQGTFFNIEVGNHEVILTNKLTGEKDTVRVIVACVEPELITEEILMGRSDTICLGFEQLLGKPVTIKNICPNSSGTNVQFSLINNDSCIVFKGLTPGKDTACFVFCDQLGICDTTTFIITTKNLTGGVQTVRDTIVTNSGVNTFCIDTTSLGSFPSSIVNICPNSSGTNVVFTINPITFCVSYTGTAIAGLDTACIVVCDSFGFCDTTNLIVEVFKINKVNFLDTIFVNSAIDTCIALPQFPTPIVSIQNITPQGDNGLFQTPDTCTTASGMKGVRINFSGTVGGGTDTAYILVKDAGGLFDTVKVFITVLNPQLARINDTLTVGKTRTYCIDTTQLSGTVINFTNICPNNSGSSINFVLNPQTLCVTAAAATIGPDTACIVICDNFGVCDTTIIIVNGVNGIIIPTPSLINDTLSVGRTRIYCVDTSQVAPPYTSFTNVCPSSSGTSVSFVLNPITHCLTATSTAVGADTACIVLCNNQGICDTTIYIINGIKAIRPTPSLVSDTLTIGKTRTYCIDTSEVTSPIISFVNACPSSSGTSINFVLNPQTLCVTATATAVGADTACIIICNNQGICDTTIIIVGGLDPAVPIAPPVAKDDTDTTLQNTPITINVVFNDTVAGVRTQFFQLIGLGPLFGTVVFSPDGSVIYRPSADFCGGTDIFKYVICNAGGCDTATVVVYVECGVLDKPFKIYDGFSPNGDNINDVFTIDGLDKYPNHTLCVYTRWGHQVLNVKNYQNDWSGTWKGDNLPDGTYFYVFSTGVAGQKNIAGYVQIHR